MPSHISNKKFTFPSSMTDSIGRIDQFTEIMKDEGDKLDKKIQTEKKIKGKINNNIYKEQLSDFKESILEFENTDDKNILINNVKTLFQLITEESDSIWPYIIRNMYKPLAISFKKVDVILGNPPWEKVKTERHQHWARYFPGLRGLTQREREAKITELSETYPELQKKTQLSIIKKLNEFK